VIIVSEETIPAIIDEPSGFRTIFCIQNYWDFGICPSSSALKTTEHNVPEMGFISIFR
jgi:hypothetical protein